jgi:hypothetical protein
LPAAHEEPDEERPPEPASEAEGNIVIVPLTGVVAVCSVGTVGTVVDGIDAATGDHAITVNAGGVRSESRLTEGGKVSLAVDGAASIGEPGEEHAIRTLRQRLEASGLPISLRPGDNKRGEDGILIVADQSYTLQLVTTPNDPAFWHQASAGSAMSEVQLTDAVDWVRATVLAKAKKTPPGQRPRTVLVLDAQHAGILANRAVIDSCLGRFRSPPSEFGFASVWVVGPTVPYCVRLGDGVP